MLSSRIKKRYVNVYNYNRLGKSNPHGQTNQPMKILLQKKRKRFKSSNKLVNTPNSISSSFLGSDRKRKREGGGGEQLGIRQLRNKMPPLPTFPQEVLKGLPKELNLRYPGQCTLEIIRRGEKFAFLFFQSGRLKGKVKEMNWQSSEASRARKFYGKSHLVTED